MATKCATVGGTSVVRTDEEINVYTTKEGGKAILVDHVVLPSVGKAKEAMNSIVDRLHKNPDTYKS